MSAILYDSRDGIAEITINRPEKYNILTHEVVAELHAAWVDEMQHQVPDGGEGTSS